MTVNSYSAHTRSITNGKLVEIGKSALTQANFINDAIKAWNSTTEEVKQSLTYNVAKKTLRLLLKHFLVNFSNIKLIHIMHQL